MSADKEDADTEDGVLYDKQGPRATIWLNRPEVRNALDTSMVLAFRAFVAQASADPEVRVIVIRGRGHDFCTGTNLRALDTERLTENATSFDPRDETGVYAIRSGLRMIENDDIPKPTISVVEGYAVAGGFELMLSTDFAIASEDAQIGDAHLRRGLVGAAGVLWAVARMSGLRRMKDLLLTARLLSAAEGYEWGLVNRVVPAADLDAAVDELVESLVSIDPWMLHLAKQLYGRSLEADKETLLLLEKFALMGALGRPETAQAIEAFSSGQAPGPRPER
jgi:enoyl-CoA hydratase